MTDPSRITAWLTARAPHDALLSGTVHEIIVALLQHIEGMQYRIEALEADVAMLKERNNEEHEADKDDE